MKSPFEQVYDHYELTAEQLEHKAEVYKKLCTLLLLNDKKIYSMFDSIIEQNKPDVIIGRTLQSTAPALAIFIHKLSKEAGVKDYEFQEFDEQLFSDIRYAFGVYYDEKRRGIK